MNEEIVGNADIEENSILDLDKNILAILLQDKTTKKNIIWATDDYLDLGTEYASAKEITIELITGEHGGVIKPRSVKTREEQAVRVRNMAEVFTPTWICNKQANLTDDGWFVENKGFNVEKENAWEVNEGKVEFINKDKDAPNGWMHYLSRKCLEITCGEAPYLVSRYDTVTGDLIPLYSRIGLLDRKMRIINEKIRNFKDKNKSKKRWLMLAKRALHSTYGFEWSGDNVLLARENILASVREYYKDKFEEDLDVFNLEKFAEIIAWNIWQMDGLKCVVPNSCHDYVKKIEIKECDLFDKKESSVKLLSKSKSYYDIVENEIEKCQGCVKDNLHLHNGIYCKVKDWISGKKYFFKNLVDEQRGIFSMSKDFRFDVVIGNPPYQKISENNNRQSPVYHLFMDEAYKLGGLTVLITPARFLFNAGQTPKAWNEKMLEDRHFKVLLYDEDCSKFFSNTDIKGGIAISLRDRSKEFNPIGIFNKYTEVNSILNKVLSFREKSISSICVGAVPYRYSSVILREHPEYNILLGPSFDLRTNTLDKLANKIYFEIIPKGADENEYIQIFGLYEKHRRCMWVKKDFILCDVVNFNKNKVLVSKASGTGKFGEALSEPVVVGKNVGHTQSFISIGSFDDKKGAQNLEKYIKTKFVRCLLSVLKTTQDINPSKWKYIPLQKFDINDEINWDTSIVNIDKQLYKKYKLNNAEVEFIEKNVKEMD